VSVLVKVQPFNLVLADAFFITQARRVWPNHGRRAPFLNIHNPTLSVITSQPMQQEQLELFNGSDYEHAQKLERERERDEAIRQLENIKASSIHSCHDQCQRPMCVLRRERDELKMQLKVMHAERDVARISARKSDEAHDRVIGDLERADVIAEKAKELIARWDQPSWKDTAPTAGFIYALRDAVEAYEKTTK
jgi:hypothetical protein